jgi:hypothetical protein
MNNNGRGNEILLYRPSSNGSESTTTTENFLPTSCASRRTFSTTEDLTKIIKLQSVTILEDRLRVCENNISILDFIPRQLLDNLIGNNNSIANVVIDFCEEKVFCLSNGEMSV